MDSFQLFLIKTLVGMSNRGVVGMLCTMDMHRLYIRFEQHQFALQIWCENKFLYNFFLFLAADFLSTEKNVEQKKNNQKNRTLFVLIKERGVKDTCIFIFLPNFFLCSLTLALKFKRILFFGNIKII